MQNRVKYLKDILNKNSEAFLILLLVLFFITEAITKITVFSNLKKIEIQAGGKAIVFGLVLMGLVLYKRKELIYIFILATLFIIGQINIPNSFELPVVTYFLKYLFPIGLFGFFLVQPTTPKLKLLNLFEYLLVVNSVLIIVGLIFEIEHFRTYTGERFGYNGLIVTSSASTYLYIIGMCYFLARYQKDIVRNWRFWLIALSSLVVGTKSIVLALAAISLFYIVKYVRSKKYKRSLMAIIIAVILSFGYYLFFINPLFQSLTQTEGLLTSFLSLRDQLFMEYTLPYIQENWGVWNYFLGGVSNFELRPQMALFDMLFFWGIIGSLAYSYFYVRSFFQFEFNNVLTYFIMILILLIAFLAGNFFYNASVVIYLIILRESLTVAPLHSNPK